MAPRALFSQSIPYTGADSFILHLLTPFPGLMVGWIDDEYFSQLSVEAPTGLDKLDGTAYGGITITDVISR